MSLYRPRELFAFLEAIDARPKKSLSQNFLIDGNIIGKLLDAIPSHEPILEIGPGPGSITEQLLKRGFKVHAVEKDPRLANHLTRLEGGGAEECAQKCTGALTFYNDDILTFDINLLPRPLHIVANIPFGITTPILTRFIPLASHISSLTLIVQHEYAERLIAQPRTKAYSSLTLFLTFYASCKYLFRIKPACFSPKPKVSAAAVQIIPRAPLSTREGLFFQLVRTAFSMRRKQLKSSLRTLYAPEKIISALESIGHKPTARPEELTSEEYVSLVDALAPQGPTRRA